jgi:L-aminopeptidase/D-esterase-like protein
VSAPGQAQRSASYSAVKGGLGTASRRVGDVTVGAVVVVNAVGEVLDETGQSLVGPRITSPSSDLDPGDVLADGDVPLGASTTIGVVATDLPLDKAGATRLAQAAHDGLARAVWPAHTAFDGDTFFALSTAHDRERVWPVPIAITSAAADVVATAIRRAARAARGLGGVPALADARSQTLAPPERSS